MGELIRDADVPRSDDPISSERKFKRRFLEWPPAATRRVELLARRAGLGRRVDRSGIVHAELIARLHAVALLALCGPFILLDLPIESQEQREQRRAEAPPTRTPARTWSSSAACAAASRTAKQSMRAAVVRAAIPTPRRANPNPNPNPNPNRSKQVRAAHFKKRFGNGPRLMMSPRNYFLLTTPFATLRGSPPRPRRARRVLSRGWRVLGGAVRPARLSRRAFLVKSGRSPN